MVEIKAGWGKSSSIFLYLFSSLFVQSKLVAWLSFLPAQTSRKTAHKIHEDVQTGPFSQREVIQATGALFFFLV